MVMKTSGWDSPVSPLSVLTVRDRAVFPPDIPQRSREEAGAGWDVPFLFPVECFQSRGSFSTEITEITAFEEAVPRSGLTFLPAVTRAEG